MARDEQGENLRVVLPKNATVNYSPMGSRMKFTDASGKDLNKSEAGQRARLVTGGDQKVIELTARKE